VYWMRTINGRGIKGKAVQHQGARRKWLKKDRQRMGEDKEDGGGFIFGHNGIVTGGDPKGLLSWIGTPGWKILSLEKTS